MSWKELSHEDGHVLVEYGDGSRLNVRYVDLIARHDPCGPVLEPSTGGPAISIAATRYRFRAGDLLPSHEHSIETLHDIFVESGEVLVMKDSGEVRATEGQRVHLGVGEKHAIKAITDATTLHTILLGKR
jgi:quercetin dioxygenase-like cupin family protein